MRTLLFICSFFLVSSFPTAFALHVPKTSRKPTEAAVKKYEQFVAEGAFLSEEGWNRAMKLFASPSPYPKKGIIVLESTGGLIGEDWVNGDSALVETKWTGNFGTIDSKLRYKPPHPGMESIGVIGQFGLTRIVDAKSGAQEWKIKGTPGRVATIPKALAYVTSMRDQTTDPVIQKNAEKTMKILRRLKGCGVNPAC